MEALQNRPECGKLVAVQDGYGEIVLHIERPAL